MSVPKHMHTWLKDRTGSLLRVIYMGVRVCVSGVCASVTVCMWERESIIVSDSLFVCKRVRGKLSG